MRHHHPEDALLRVRREFGEHGGVTPSIARSSTFTVMDPSTMPEIFEGVRGVDKGGCFLYSRQFNPTVDVLGRYLAAMEGTGSAICTASGMAAISCTLMQICRCGDHIVASDTIYGGTFALLNELLPQNGVATTFVDVTDVEAVAEAITPKTRVLYTEVLGNPTLNTADIPALAKICRPRGVRLVVDNTFTPVVVSPAVLGADVVVHSMTKFINGASDLIAGAICADAAFIRELMDLHTGRVMLLGPTIDPRAAFDIIQRLPHLPIRMKEHGRRALAVARELDKMGVAVTYPGLSSYPQHDCFNRIRNRGYGFGGILTVDLGSQERAEKLMDILQNREQFGFIAVSLGFFDTLLSCSGTSTSSEVPEKDREKIGISPGLMRIAMGFTGRLDTRLEQIRSAVRDAGLV